MINSTTTFQQAIQDSSLDPFSNELENGVNWERKCEVIVDLCKLGKGIYHQFCRGRLPLYWLDISSPTPKLRKRNFFVQIVVKINILFQRLMKTDYLLDVCALNKTIKPLIGLDKKIPQHNFFHIIFFQKFYHGKNETEKGWEESYLDNNDCNDTDKRKKLTKLHYSVRSLIGTIDACKGRLKLLDKQLDPILTNLISEYNLPEINREKRRLKHVEECEKRKLEERTQKAQETLERLKILEREEGGKALFKTIPKGSRSSTTTELHRATLYALHWGYEVYGKVIDFLLNHADVDINVQDSDGNTPLHIAFEYSSGDDVKAEKIINILVEHPKINLHIKNKYKKSAYDFLKLRQFSLDRKKEKEAAVLRSAPPTGSGELHIILNGRTLVTKTGPNERLQFKQI